MSEYVSTDCPTGQSTLTLSSDGGFTLVEMMVTLAVSAVVLTALAGSLFGSLRSLTVQKARTQGNEVATLGIESLQRLPYDELGNCATTERLLSSWP